MVETIFWMTLLLLLYTFIGYPFLVKVLAVLSPKRHVVDESYTPSVSIVLSVFNEEAVMRDKIENFFALDYPADFLEFIIVSDKCSDRTDEIIRSYENDRIKLLVQERRSGKTLNLNRGVAEAVGDVIIFTDANSMFDRDVVRKLVRHFFDPAVGLVSGKSVYCDAAGSVTTGGAYRRYEDFIKESESQLAGIIGADGAIYALRKSLYTSLSEQYINDFIHTIQVVLAERRAISDEFAVCREVVEETGSGELRRQTRIMAQSWLIFVSQVGHLFKSGKFLYLWQFISHKFLRWLTVPLMLILYIIAVVLLNQGFVYQLVFTGLSLFMLFAISGAKLKGGLTRTPYLFTILHVAALFGFYRYIKGNMYTTWNPRNN